MIRATHEQMKFNLEDKSPDKTARIDLFIKVVKTARRALKYKDTLHIKHTETPHVFLSTINLLLCAPQDHPPSHLHMKPSIVMELFYFCFFTAGSGGTIDHFENSS